MTNNKHRFPIKPDEIYREDLPEQPQYQPKSASFAQPLFWIVLAGSLIGLALYELSIHPLLW